MTPYYDKDGITIYNGDCLEVLRKGTDNSVDAIVTDPPYGLSFMGKKWDYDVPSVEIWRECLRVLKPGGYLLAFAGTRTQHRMACNIEDAGFEIRDMIAWVYGSGFPKSLNIGKAVDKLLGNEREKIGYCRRGNSVNTDFFMSGGNDIPKGTSEWEGYGTALKPSHEDITLAQKPLTAVPFCDIMHKTIKTIGGALCQLPLLVKIAEKSLRSNPRELEGELDIALWTVGESINIQGDLNALMDILQLASKENTNWNIVLLWLNILADLYEMETKFTTSMKDGMIIELKILNSLPWLDIFQNIIRVKDSQVNGLNSNALIAVNLFNALKMKLDYIHTHSAQDPAMLKDGLSDLRPKLEPITVARKPLSEKTVAENCLKWGVGGIDIDGSRVPMNETLKMTRPARNPKTDKLAPQTNRKDVPYEYENSLGRFPANLIHDGSDEVVACFPNDSQRFFYCAKASKKERDMGCEGLEEKQKIGYSYSDEPNDPANGMFKDRETKNKNNHPTVKPIALMKYLVNLVSREGHKVLDPFMGSGTTGIACKELNRKVVGIELSEEYCEIAVNRIDNVQPELFN